jgi:hypothetical protein
MHRSRQLDGIATSDPEGEAPTGTMGPHRREDGEDNAFRDITRMSGDENEIGDTRFDNPGPDVENEGPMEPEHTSNTR